MYKSFMISEFKHFEFQAQKFKTGNSFDFNIGFSRKCDHAGFYFSISVLEFSLIINILDTRHWNDDEDRWYIDGECYDDDGCEIDTISENLTNSKD